MAAADRQPGKFGARQPQELLDELGVKLTPDSQLHFLQGIPIENRRDLLEFLIETATETAESDWQAFEELVGAYRSTRASLAECGEVALGGVSARLLRILRSKKGRAVFFDKLFNGAELQLLPECHQGAVIDYAIQYDSESTCLGLRPGACASLMRAADSNRLIALTKLACTRLDAAYSKNQSEHGKAWERALWTAVRTATGLAALNAAYSFAGDIARCTKTRLFLFSLQLSDPNYDPFDPNSLSG